MLREEIRKAPLLRALIPLAAGMVFSRCLDGRGFSPGPFGMWICIPLIILFALILLIAIFFRKRADPSFSRFYALLVQGFFFLAGILFLPGNAGTDNIPCTEFSGRICSDVAERERFCRLTLDRISVVEDSLWSPLQAKSQVYIRKDSLCAGLQPGMRLLLEGRLDAYTPGKEGFDYGTYLAGKGIVYTSFIDNDSWRVIDSEKGSLTIIALNLRHAMTQLLEEKLPSGLEAELLSALLLGYRGGLPDGLKEQFRRSGCMHILAISGLHVGILYFLPFMMIRRIRRPRFLRAGLSALLLLLLWAYALLAGMSPSVSRAAGMCTIYGLASLAKRRVTMVQVMSLAALIMLLVRPAMIFEAGFQLSFMALAGIAMFYQRLNGLFTFERIMAQKRIMAPKRIMAQRWIMTLTRLILQWAWRMTSLSLSAQAGTAPLVIWHFGQYPAYSLLSNLAAVPLAMLILYNGILFFSFFWIPSLIRLFSFTLHKLACMLNGLTELVAGLPGAMLPGDLPAGAAGGAAGACSPGFSILQVLLVYALIFFTWLFLEKRNAFSLMAVLLSIFLLLFSQSVT